MTNKPAHLDKNLFDRLVVARDDLRMAKECADIISHERPRYDLRHFMEDRRVWFNHRVYTTALVVAYGRMFKEAKGWPKLSGKLLRNLSEPEKAMHKMLLDWRDEVFAHSDSKHRNVTSFAGRGESREVDIGMVARLDEAQVVMFQTMATKLTEAIDVRISELRTALFKPSNLATPPI